MKMAPPTGYDQLKCKGNKNTETSSRVTSGEIFETVWSKLNGVSFKLIQVGLGKTSTKLTKMHKTGRVLPGLY